MSFLLPLALLGLLTLPAILLLHLLRNRREQLPISSIQLWRGLQQKKYGDLPRNIPLSLLLFLQLIVAIALTLGLARPVLSFLLAQPQQTIFILDVTTSMTAEDVSQAQATNRFDAARQFIRTRLEALDDQDTFALISLNVHPEILLSGDAEQKTQALAALDNLTPGATGVDLPAALSLANGLVDPEDPTRIVILTDGNYAAETQDLPAVLAPVEWQIINSVTNETQLPPANQALLNVSTQTWPDDRHRLFARVVNYSDSSVERTVRVSIGERLFDEVTVQLQAQGEATRVWTLPEPTQTVAVEIVEPDVLLLDNRAELLLLNETANRRVLLVSETPEILARALEAQPGVELTIDQPSTRGYDPADFDLTVFEDKGFSVELTAWPRGSVLVVNPPLGHPLLATDHMLRGDIRPDMTTASTLLNGVDLSGVYFSQVTHLTLPEWTETDLMAAPSTAERAGTPISQEFPLIFHGSVGNSQIVVWTFDVGVRQSNLSARLALPLLTANTLSNLVAVSIPPVAPPGEPVLINRNLSVEIPNGRRLLAPISPAGNETNHQEQLFSRTNQPGIYRIYNENNTLVAGFAVHAGSALESNLATRLQPDILNLAYVPKPTTAGPQIEYQEFWPWLVGLALIVVIIEGGLAWLR